ncbi:MAG: hypothetical protein WCI73_18190, partial [Phycisphaerae bacterium]
QIISGPHEAGQCDYTRQHQHQLLDRHGTNLYSPCDYLSPVHHTQRHVSRSLQTTDSPLLAIDT